MGVRGTALGALLLCSCAFALDPALDVSQYAHTSWKIREGFSKGIILSIAQTPDGYLWLGTEFGLLRFDGVRNVPWQPPADQPLPSRYITSLLATREGTLWIGTRKGLASWRGGKLTRYPELAGLAVYRLVGDQEGTVWAGAWGTPTGRLCAIEDGRVHCSGEDGGLGPGVFGLYEDKLGNLWAGLANGLWRWKPGTPKFYSLPGEPNGIQGLAEGDDNALLIATKSGIRRLINGKIETAFPLPGAARQSVPKKLLCDREGGLWIGTMYRGLAHIHEGRTDVFSQSDGLSGDFVLNLAEDHEGNIWVATTNGLDRFRNFAVAAFSANEGWSNVEAVLAARDGSVWAGTFDGLQRWKNGQVTAYREHAHSRPDARATVHEIAGSGLPDHGLSSLFQDFRGRIWVSTRGAVGYVENDRFIPVSGLPGGVVHSMAEDTEGNLWIANQDLGLYRLSPRNEIQQTSWAKLGHKDGPLALAGDPSQGVWVGFFLGGLVYFTDGQVRASYTAAEGLGEGAVNDLRFDRDDVLWAATEGGLSRLKNGRIATLSGKSGLPCDAVHWVIEDDDHSLWLNMPCGLVRIARSELEAWVAAAHRTIKITVFDGSDGVKSLGQAIYFSPQAGKSPDGKLWFTTVDSLSVVDPRHIAFNKLLAPVHIEQITADRKRYDANAGLHLPPLIRDLQIDYTALSLVAPEKMLFRYKLEGYDPDWQDAGTRRQVFYTNLPPRNYRFRVTACNNSGVWNEAGAFLDFAIDPAYYQSTWFRLSCVAAVAALLAGLYQLRLRYLRQQFNVRMEERVNERTRLARDLHDTLLQSLSGVLLKLHGVTYMLPDKPEAKKTLESVIDQARQAVSEGRDTVYGLRSSTVTTNDLARSISSLGEELATGPTGGNSPFFQVRVEGKTRDLHPIVRDEVNRIASEAVRNAFLHAQAGRIEVEIRYDERQFRLRVRDDGKGIDEKVLDEGRTGHYGLPGIRERAKLVGGKLAIWSELDSGTEIELTVPASAAYAKSPVPVARQKARGSDSGDIVR
jgi:signal transduction histidine kinase/ligand-binding sensor domain-containing protein